MYSSVHFDGMQLLVNNAAYRRRHDIVYRSPSYEACNGFPMGDGDRTCVCFPTEKSLEFVFRKSDALRLAPDGAFQAWAWESEERHSGQVTSGSLSLSDGMPSLDCLYLTSFEQRLNMADGLWTHTSQTAFSTWTVKSFFSLADKVLVLQADMTSDTPCERSLTLERFGSRFFYHYYEQIAPCADKGLSDVVRGERDGCFYVGQLLGSAAFVTCAKLTKGKAAIRFPHGRGVKAVFEASGSLSFSLLLTIETGNTVEDALAKALQNLAQAESREAELPKRHSSVWHDFWSQSLICLPEHDYLENVYTAHLYALRCCGTGKYPTSFTGPFAYRSDVRNWGHVYHWNQQQVYWPLPASGHWALMRNMADYRAAMLPQAVSDAGERFGAEGAFFSDIANLNGFQAFEPDTVRNFTCGPQIALSLFEMYRYNGDRAFLEEQAYPLMKAAGDFYASILEKTDGSYHIKGGATAYESYLCLRDTITDWAHIRALFEALLVASEIVGDDRAKPTLWRDIIENRFEVPVTTENGQPIFSAGWRFDGTALPYNEGVYPLSPFPACQLSPVYPTGLLGLRDVKDPLFEVAVNTLKVICEEELNGSRKMGCSGHSPLPQTAARLGQGDLALALLYHYTEKYQVFTNGLTHFSDVAADQQWARVFRPRVLEPGVSATQWEVVHEKGVGPRVSIPSQLFLHSYWEGGSNIAAGLQEMLLQSHDGVIRLFPAVPDGMTAVIKLFASDGFCITSEICQGDIRYAHIVSLQGQSCHIQPPWHESVSITCDGDPVAFSEVDGILEFATEQGRSYTLCRKAFPLACFYTEPLPEKINMSCKRQKTAMIGTPSMCVGSEV